MRAVRSTLLTLVLAFCVGFATEAKAQETGTVTGQVTDAATGQPLTGVQIQVVGTNLGGLSDQSGRYLINRVPVGQHTVRAVLIGYSQATQTVTITAGGTATADLEMGESAIAIEGVVVTATGQLQRRREVGSTVANINVDQVNLAPIQTFSQLIQGRAAGVNVLQSAGTSGTGARVRIRGSNSISLSNEPMLIVDGIQVDNAPESQAFGLGGQTISRLNDINPEDVESVEILKGPAASALYGTAAANGVIQITTKRGRAGSTRWNFYSEYGQINDVTDYPANYEQLGTDGEGETVWCPVIDAADDLCTPTETLSWNPLEQASPFRTGIIRTFGLNVRGGSDQVQYFISGESENEDGIYQSNSVERISVRANLDAKLHDNLDFGVNSGYTRSNLALPGNDNNTFGFIGAGLLGNAEDNDFNRGFFAYPNEWRFALDRLQNTHRFIGSADMNWRPLRWLTLSGTGGMDLLNRDDVSAVAPGIWLASLHPNNAMGTRFLFAGTIRNYTARSSAIASFELTPEINSTTTIGAAFREDRFERVDAGGFNMLPGTDGLGSLSERFAVDEFNQTTRTVSGLASQQLAWRDRVYLTGAIRGDRNSNFGQEFGFQWYPSVSASWVIAEEPWFPRSDLLSSMRIRTAWGRSGLMPDFRTANQFFDATTATIRGSSVPAVTVGGAGNPDLKPEKSQEWELGVDLGLVNDRFGLELAYYDKESTDALVQRRLPPSLGSSATQWVNLGKVSNSGFEALLNARLAASDAVRWDATFSFATNDNELVELGEGIEPIIFGIGADSQRHGEGEALGHYWGSRIIEWSDANADGLIGFDEVVLSEEPEILGQPFPTRDISISSTITVFDRVRVSAMIDHRGGHQLFNSTEEFRCNTFFNCRPINDPAAPLEEQARAVAAVLGSIDGYVEDADFTKLREASLTVLGIDRWLGNVGIRGLTDVSLTISGRNLATWTDYTGLDPEMNSGGQANFSTYEFLGQPPVRTWTVRLNVGF